jgi:hypothetical protein
MPDKYNQGETVSFAGGHGEVVQVENVGEDEQLLYVVSENELLKMPSSLPQIRAG